MHLDAKKHKKEKTIHNFFYLPWSGTLKKNTLTQKPKRAKDPTHISPTYLGHVPCHRVQVARVRPVTSWRRCIDEGGRSIASRRSVREGRWIGSTLMPR